MNLTYHIIDKKLESIFTLKEVKNFLRISHSYDDDLIKNLIDAAIDYAENFTGKFIYTRQIKCSVIQTKNKIQLKYIPFIKITSVKKIIKNRLEDITKLFEKVPERSNFISIDREYEFSDLEIEYACGYGKDLPQAVKIGMLRHIAAMYELDGDSSAIMQDIRNLYTPYRKFTI